MERVVSCLILFGYMLKKTWVEGWSINIKEEPKREKIVKCEKRQVVRIVFEKIYD